MHNKHRFGNMNQIPATDKQTRRKISNKKPNDCEDAKAKSENETYHAKKREQNKTLCHTRDEILKRNMQFILH